MGYMGLYGDRSTYIIYVYRCVFIFVVISIWLYTHTDTQVCLCICMSVRLRLGFKAGGEELRGVRFQASMECCGCVIQHNSGVQSGGSQTLSGFWGSGFRALGLGLGLRAFGLEFRNSGVFGSGATH